MLHDTQQASKLLGFAMTHVASCSSATHWQHKRSETIHISVHTRCYLNTYAVCHNCAFLPWHTALCIYNHADHINLEPYASLGIRQAQQSTPFAAALQQTSRQVRAFVGKLLPVLKFAARQHR